ncbi:hypothetical protein CK203_047063 [Vitis vinifera]|uniref:Reverse transcriptase domain-containing protein n=1 Tax=Vitis vinifera TaxID=29760 RepID=A0A438HDW0_VITVI|nr:hypothetical protein CK203_047063 [Vitis vinifera]
MCIQETKVQCMTDSIARSIGSGRFLGWRAVNAEGASGGIFICWDRRALDMLDWEEGREECFMGRVWGDQRAVGGSLCIGGDFNITLFSRERSGQRRISSAMRNFAEIVDDLGLVDLPLQGGDFTWNGGLHNQTWARLDSGGGIRQGPTPFRFENMWLKAKDLKSLYAAGGKESMLGVVLATTLQQVEFWDREENDRILTMEEVELKKEAKENYKKWVIMEETHWRQLSREIWLKEGDRNTGFFHRMAKDMGWKADIGSLQLDQISQEEAEMLERPFTEEEIQGALMEMNGDKAPGPDGFTGFLAKLLGKCGAEDLGILDLSVLGGLYKLLAKVLANRLKRVVGKVVSNSQNAFVRGRQILDASLIANEVLQKMGFGSKWVGWMWSCLSSAKFSVMVNGVPAGCNIRGGSESPLHISHLFFADDTIIFSASGLKINLAKSEIIPVGEVVGMEELAVELGCKVGSLPSQYLGLPLGIRQRGLGIRKLALLNKALLGKWIWRYASDKDNLWKQVIKVKYGQEDFGWRPKKTRGRWE